jgi:uncharacterized protein (TIGR02284 family)
LAFSSATSGFGQYQAFLGALGGLHKRLNASRLDQHKVHHHRHERAVLAECERGEDAAKAAYEAALQKSLPADVRTLVERQYQGVKANHDRVRNLRNAAT